MTMHDRCVAYARSPIGQRYPDSCPYVSPTGRWVYGHWVIGNLFKNKTRYYGAYPPTYVERVRAMFPDVRDRDLLHVFSGELPKGKYTRLDIKPALKPELCGSVYDIAELTRRRDFKLVMADPIYTAADAEHYGTPPVDKARTMRALARVLEPGAHVVWLDSNVPIYRSDQWLNWGDVDLSEWCTWGDIDVRRSTNQRRRGVLFFERKAA